MTWTLQTAREFCRDVETIAPDFGAHVALTGGCLYKVGERKDVDVVLYRVRQSAEINIKGLWQALEKIGVLFHRDCGWCVKASYNGKPVDFFLPERPAASVPAEASEYDA